MKHSEIKVGERYLARVSSKLMPVVVLAIREGRAMHGGKACLRWVYDVRNMETGRTVTFRSAQRFRSHARPESQTP